MITTDNERINELSRLMQDQGKIAPGENLHDFFGYNWRMSELNAIIGLAQLRHIDYFLKRRREIAETYDKKLKNLSGLKPLRVPEKCKSSYYKYIAFLDDDIDREKFKGELKEKFGVSLPGEVYAIPLHKQRLWKKRPELILNHEKNAFPNAEYACSRQVCLPIYPGLKEEEINYVVESIRKVIG